MIRAAFIWPNPTSPPAKRRAWLGKRPLLLVSALSAIVVATYPGAATVPDYAKRLFSQLTSGPTHSETTSPRAVNPPLGAVEASIVSEPEAEIPIPGPSTGHREPEQKLTQPSAALSLAHSDALPVATDPSGRHRRPTTSKAPRDSEDVSFRCAVRTTSSKSMELPTARERRQCGGALFATERNLQS